MRKKLDYRQPWYRLARAGHKPVMEDMLHIRRHRGKRITRRWRKYHEPHLQSRMEQSQELLRRRIGDCP